MKLLAKILLMVVVSISLTMGIVSYLSVEKTREVVNHEIEHLMSNNLAFAEAKILEENQNIRRTTEIITLHPALNKAFSQHASLGVNRVLNDLTAVYPYFHYILIVEPDGNIFASSTRDNQKNRIPGERLLGLNFRSNPLFPELISDKMTIGSPGTDPFLSIMGMKTELSQWFVAPIRKGDETIGWIVVAYKWKTEINRLLKQIFSQLKKTADPVVETLIIDEDQNIIASAQELGGTFHVSPKKLGMIKSIIFGQRPLRLIISFDRDQANQPVTQLTRLLLSISIISAIIMMLLLAFIFRQLLLKRLNMLQRGTQELTKGNLAYQIPFLGGDEIGSLSTAFNQMSQTLRKTVNELHEYQTTLELKVDERTKELQQITGNLEKSIAQNRAIVETAPNGIITINEKGLIQSFNSAAEQMFGYSAQEIIGQNVRMLMPESYHRKHDFYIQDYLKKSEKGILGRGLVLKGRRKDKTEFSIYLTISELRFEEDFLFTGIVIDITERQELDAKIRESEEILRSTLSSIDDLVFSLDKEGVFLEYRQPLSSALYTPPERFVGKPHREVLPPHLADVLDVAIANVMTKNTVEQLDYPLEVQGDLRWYTAKVSSRLDMEGRVNGVTIVSRDITDRKQAEEEIKKAKEAAEKNAEKLDQFARELELKNDELEKARIDAEAANNAKSEFLANMSHEIRTPLNAVIGFSELMANLVVDEKQQRYLDSIQTSGNSLLTLINDVLDLSKIEAGKMVLDYEEVNLGLICNEIKQIFSLQLSEKNLDFAIRLDPGIPRGLMLDETRIRQILLNLVGNAVKFTEKGEITITVAQKNRSPEKDKLDLTIAVSDTGIGIDENQHRPVFESFVQQEGQSKSKYSGTGLGLTITKRLVEMMNGTISVKSSVGQGATFYVELNEVSISAAKSHPTTPTESLKLNNTIFEKSLVLVVDDILYNRKLICETLKWVGLEVIEAENGQQSLQLAAESQPDLILMDIRMPVMDGYEATRRLKSNSETSHIPILALTASVLAEEKNKTGEEEFAGFLTKPILTPLLMKELSRFLKYYHLESTENVERADKEKLSTMELKESIDLLPATFRELRTEIIPKWGELQGALDMQEIKNFAQMLLQFAGQHEVQHLQTYSQKLLNYLDALDIEWIESTLKAFPAELKALHKLQ